MEFIGQTARENNAAKRLKQPLDPISNSAYKQRPHVGTRRLGRLGRVAEWLCSGLQIRVRRFNSGLGLHRPQVRALMWETEFLGLPYRLGRPLIRSSSAVEQPAVNRLVGGSNPSSGANKEAGHPRMTGFLVSTHR